MKAKFYIAFVDSDGDTDNYYNAEQMFPVVLASEATKYSTREKAKEVASALGKSTSIFVFTSQSSTS